MVNPKQKPEPDKSFLGPGLELVLTIVTILSVCFASYLYLDSKYAKSIDLTVLDTRLQLKIKEDLQSSAMERVWKLEDRAVTNPHDEQLINDLRKAKADLSTYQADTLLLKTTLANGSKD